MSRRRVALLGLAGLALLLVAGLLAVVGLTRHPQTALEAWRELDRLRFGGRDGALVLDSGERVAYTELGRRDDPVLVLVHGLRGESTVMLPMAAHLSEGGYRVLALDLPGHGRSGAPREPLTIDRASRLVLEVLDRRDVETPRALIGHSMGGWIVAWSGLSSPARCGELVLISSGGLSFEPPPFHVLMPDNPRDARRSLPWLFHDPPDPPRFVLSMAAARPMEGSMDLLRSGLSGEFVLEGLLPGMVPRTLVLWGAHDRLIPPELGRRMAAAIPSSEHLEVPNSGHMVVWEEPKRTAEAILAFLRR
jgi:pimeloyl-ACP methyl ester carboxylesterase